MILKEVKIKNFRSIKEIEINFSFRCRVLIGINESGKTNILHALRLLSDQYQIQPTDRREPLSKEGRIKESYVIFYFSLEPQEISEFRKMLTLKILGNGKEIIEKVINTFKNRKIGYKVDILSKRKEFLLRELFFDKFQLEDTSSAWKKPKLGVNFSISLEGEQVPISRFWILDTSQYKIPSEYVEEILDFPEYFFEKISSLWDIEFRAKDKLPSIIFWEYREENFLPPLIEIEKFKLNPEVCRPLLYMFVLAGIEKEKIEEEIEKSIQTSSQSFRNLLQRVAKVSTREFRKIWKEYKNVEFSLQSRPPHIECGIKDVENIYPFEQRSDGFKRFVSLLLMLSYPSRKGVLKNQLILIDQADTDLHPSSAKYLKEELIKLSQNNHVVYSTHSIFMIDRKNLRRHYIIKKKNEITKIEEATESNIFTEEVLYNALGISVFEILKERNILFEGWRDYKLFETALQTSKVSSEIKKFFKEIGGAYAQGVKDISRITPILQLADRKVLIITDSDQLAKEQQKKFKENRGWGEWMRYEEIIKGIATQEDFIKNKKVIETLKKLGIPTKDLKLKRNNKLETIKRFLRNKGYSDEEIREKLENFKQALFEEMSERNNIEKEYFEFLKQIKEKLEKL